MPATHPLDTGLSQVTIFASLDDRARSLIAQGFAPVVVKRGGVLMRQGEPADALYMVTSGRFSVTLAGRTRPVAEIGPGQPMGEIAFLTGAPRTATVVALRDSVVHRLTREDFERLTAAHPEIWRALTAALAARLATTTAGPPRDLYQRPRTIAIIAAGDEPVPEAFVQRLASALGAAGKVRVVSTEEGAEVLRSSGADTTEQTRRINELEAAHDYVVFLTNREVTPWTDKALRHADLVLAVARHAGERGLNAVEIRAAELVAPVDTRLVLLHPTRQRISGTHDWLVQRRVRQHHHVALDSASDIERLVRFISGTARGFVACGGGALCAAHVGVWRALMEAGLTFDMVGGTSAGAAMAAAFALGSDPDEIDRAIHEMFVAGKAMRRYTWPRYSLLDHQHFDRQLARFFGGIDIEDLWTPFFAVSTNLSRYALERHTHGDLWSAVRASASIPVLLPPLYTEDGEMLVDGCLLDNVPVQLMHELKHGPNVVVTFVLPELERFEVNYSALPSRAGLLRALMNPLERRALPRAPDLATVLMRSLMANRQEFTAHLRKDDLLLVPPIAEGIGFLDWHRHRELQAAAYVWTERKLESLSPTVLAPLAGQGASA
jgi:NTE family protein